MEERAPKVLAVARTRLAVLLLALLVDGQDEVDDLVADAARKTHETRSSVLNPWRIKAVRVEGLGVCESTKSVFTPRHSRRPTSPRPTSFISLASNSRSSTFIGTLDLFLDLLALFGFSIRPLAEAGVAGLWGTCAWEPLPDDLVVTMVLVDERVS